MADVNNDDSVASIDDTRIIGSDPWLETRLDHPEDVTVAEDGTLYAGGEDGQIYRIDPDENHVQTIANTGGFILGLNIGPDGNLYACDFQNHAVYRISIEEEISESPVEVILEGNVNDPPWHPNYCVFDTEGRLFVTDSGDRSDMENPNGCIYVREPDGTGRILTDELSSFPNGMAISADGSTLYIAETSTHEVSAVDLVNGHANDIYTVCDRFGMVDGLALDAEDRLYAASIGDNAVYRYEEGKVEKIIEDPAGLTIGNPTNIAFGGDDLHTMYIANLGLWHITAVTIDVPGRLPAWR